MGRKPSRFCSSTKPWAATSSATSSARAVVASVTEPLPMAMLMMAYMGFQIMAFTKMQMASSMAMTVSPRIRPRRGFFTLRTAMMTATATRITAAMAIR